MNLDNKLCIYHRTGLSQDEVNQFVAIQHKVWISSSALKRRLKNLKLCKKCYYDIFMLTLLGCCTAATEGLQRKRVSDLQTILTGHKILFPQPLKCKRHIFSHLSFRDCLMSVVHCNIFLVDTLEATFLAKST